MIRSAPSRPDPAATPPGLAALDYDLPAELVAQRPLAERDACRLLCLRRSAPRALEERPFRDLGALLRPGDVLVRNVSRVIPARLEATVPPRGSRCEILLLEPAPEGGWWVLAKPGRRLLPGVRVALADGSEFEVRSVAADGRRRLQPHGGADLLERAKVLGAMPIPPYIRRPADAADAEAYQTVYARVDGSVAAPTAGLHFTPELLAGLAARGVTGVDLVLHVGLGTFQPIRTADPTRHAMHWERFEIGAGDLARLDAARAAGGRVVAVGTTVVRSLESIAAWEAGNAAASVEVRRDGDVLHGRTRLFIHPPWTFRRVDALITNFHLPRSSLLMLVDAFAGRAAIRHAYAHAVAGRWRFFSYGDAMWIE